MYLKIGRGVMAQNISNSVVPYENSVYFEPSFHRNLLDHLELIKRSVSTQPLLIEGDVAYHSKGDLYQVFRQIGLSPKYWWITMVINNITSPEQYDGERTSFILPDLSYIDELYLIYSTKEGNV